MLGFNRTYQGSKSVVILSFHIGFNIAIMTYCNRFLQGFMYEISLICYVWNKGSWSAKCVRNNLHLGPTCKKSHIYLFMFNITHLMSIET